MHVGRHMVGRRRQVAAHAHACKAGKHLCQYRNCLWRHVSNDCRQIYITCSSASRKEEGRKITHIIQPPRAD